MNDVKKVGKALEKHLQVTAPKSFDDCIEKVKELYIESYESNLIGEGEEESLSSPQALLEAYKVVLDNFEYVTVDPEEGQIILTFPSEDTFVFEGRLGILKLIIDGVPGTYYELPIEDHIMLMNNYKISDDLKASIGDLLTFIDEDEDTGDLLGCYLLDAESDLYSKIKSHLGTDLIVSPISNMAPTDIFEEGISYIDDNIDKMIDTFIDNSIDAVT